MFCTILNVIPEKNKMVSFLFYLDLNISLTIAIIKLYCNNSIACMSPHWGHGPFIFLKLGITSCWHTIALERLSRCIKDRLRPDGRVSSMSNERSLDFILYLYHSGYARLYCSNKQPPNFSDVTQSLFPAYGPCPLKVSRRALFLVITWASWQMEAHFDVCF